MDICLPFNTILDPFPEFVTFALCAGAWPRQGRRVEVGVPCTQRNLQFGINVGYAPSCAVWAIAPQLFQVPIKIVQWAAWSRHGDLCDLWVTE